MSVIKLVTLKQVAELTNISANIDTDRISPVIIDVQQRLLQPLLGTKLYEKIQTDFNANNLTGLYLTLYNDYIVSMVCHCVESEFVNTGYMRVQNNGIFKISPDNTEQISREENSTLVKNAQTRAEFYIDNMLKFLCYERANIPEYLNQDNKYDIEPNDDNNYSAFTWFMDN